MHSSGENSRKHKNDYSKRGECRKFDKASSQMRDTLTQSCAERVIAHAAGNGGSCCQGFVKELVMSSIKKHLYWKSHAATSTTK